jgi:hypothetical protein
VIIATVGDIASVEHFRVDDDVADRLAVEHAQQLLHGGDRDAVDRFARVVERLLSDSPVKTV